MDSYPQFLLKDLRPLVFLTGVIEDEPDIHARLISTLEKCNTEIDQRDFPPISFKSVAIDHAYVHKKNPKEFQSVDGILKYSSLQKHYELLPSVLVLTAAFSVEWTSSDWSKLQDNLFEKVNRLRDQLKWREVKVIVVAVKIGTGTISHEMLDERISILRKHLMLESQRTFVAISLSDLTSQPLTSSMRKLSKNIRELSSTYYSVLEKRARFLMKTARIRGSNEGILTARYSFKLAYFLSFQGLKLQSLKYYRLSFEALLGVVLHIDEDLLDQLKTVAEYAHFKICNMLLQIGSVKEAIAQFMAYINTFTKVYCEIVWRHYSWVTEQYIVFLQLLDLHRVTNTMLQTEAADRYFFLQNALRFSLKRQENFKRSTIPSDRGDKGEKGSEGDRNRSQILNMVVSPSRYVGAMPILIDPVLSISDLDSNHSPQLTNKYLLETERAFDLYGLIFKLLQRCEDYLSSSTEGGRRRAILNITVSDQLMNTGRYEDALKMLWRVSHGFSEEDWVGPLVPLFKRILSCSLLLGRPTDYLNAAISLYSLSCRRKEENIGVLNLLEERERETLHSDILSLLKCNQKYEKINENSSFGSDGNNILFPSTSSNANDNLFPRTVPGNPSNGHFLLPFEREKGSKDRDLDFFSDSNSSLHLRSNYGAAASIDHPAERSLALNTVIVLNQSKGRLFDITTSFSAPSVEVGNSVTVSVTIESRLLTDIAIDEILIVFTGEKLFKRITHPTGIEGSADSYDAHSSNIKNINIDTKDHKENKDNRGDIKGDIKSDIKSDKSESKGIQSMKGSPGKAKGRARCCSHYCSSYMGAVRGSRSVKDHNDHSYACLFLPGKRSVTYTFSLLISESILSSLPGIDPAVCVESVRVLVRTPISEGGKEVDIFGRADNSASISDISVNTNNSGNSGNSDNNDDSSIVVQQFREVVLEISPLSPEFRKALIERSGGRKEDKDVMEKDKVGSPPEKAPVKQFHTLHDLRSFLGSHISPNILQLTHPLAFLDLISPMAPTSILPPGKKGTISGTSSGAPGGAGSVPTTPQKSASSSYTVPGPSVTLLPTADLLQGPVQRVDLIFKSGKNHIINGRVYLSSDYSPAANSSALFWCPDITPLLSNAGVNGINGIYGGINGINNGNDAAKSSDQLLDTINYNPVLLNSSYQPAQPLLLPHILPHSVYCVPLFLRSEIQSSYKLRLITEFIPKIDHISTVSKEVELNVAFLKPLHMNFSLSSDREAQCGVVREGFMSTVLEGDVVNMSASLGCANALGGEIQILGMTFIQPTPTTLHDDYYDDNGNINDTDDLLTSPKVNAPPLFQLRNGAPSVNLLQADTDAVHSDPFGALGDEVKSPKGPSSADPFGDIPSGITGPSSVNDHFADLVSNPDPSSAAGGDGEGVGSEMGLGADDTAAPIVPIDGDVVMNESSSAGSSEVVDIAASSSNSSENALMAGAIITPPPTDDKPADSNNNSDSSSNNDVVLKKGEMYVCSTDILCVESCPSPSMPLTTQVASMGDLYVDWRLHNDRILSAPDLSPWGVKTPKALGNAPRDPQKDLKNVHSVSEFDWLLQWGPWSAVKTTLSENNKLAVDRSTSTTRVCGMVFAVPRVKITPAPFDVSTLLSTSCKKNEVLPLTIVIRNKLWSAEHLSLSIKTTPNSASSSSLSSSVTRPTESASSTPVKPDDPDSSIGSSSGFLVIGNTSSLLDISPKGTCTISLSLVPLHTGFACLPHITVTWERNSAVVVELSSNHILKYIFVQP